MLSPHERSLLLQSLRPPAGYSLDRAIGTTFTLDLITLLTTPVAFTHFDYEDSNGRPTDDPLAMLESLRRYADRIHIFCHAGYIKVPPPTTRLLAFLEDSIVEVQPDTEGGLFHPKVWVLRFVSDDEPVRYRVLCLSRNLTSSRSWDTVLALDGELEPRLNAFRRNNPLGEFVAALPGLAVRPPGQALKDVIEKMQHEIRRVRFELPPGFDDVSFVALGINGGRRWRFPKSSGKMLVVSPFLSTGGLKDIQKRVEVSGIISRPEALAGIGAELLDSLGSRVWVMDPAGDLDSREGADEEESQTDELAGLHTKLFILDEGRRTRLWTGSANATDSAFRRNVEFLVGLSGKKSFCGREAFLGREGDKHTFRSLLIPYVAGEDGNEGGEEEEWRESLNGTREWAAQAGLVLEVISTSEEGVFGLCLKSEAAAPEWPDAVAIHVRPATLASSGEKALDLESETLAEFEVTSDGLTAFFVFRVTGTGGKSAEFTVKLPLLNAPENRRERILQSLLRDKGSVLRFLLMLLSTEQLRGENPGGIGEGGPGDGDGLGVLGSGAVLELLLTAVVRNPTSLKRAAEVIADLKKTPEGRKKLPDGLEDIWEPIWTACQEVHS